MIAVAYDDYIYTYNAATSTWKPKAMDLGKLNWNAVFCSSDASYIVAAVQNGIHSLTHSRTRIFISSITKPRSIKHSFFHSFIIQIFFLLLPLPLFLPLLLLYRECLLFEELWGFFSSSV